ncbi:MAG: hypothetical protein K0R84_130 [Clostridia bacterium]|jgi:signal transduction histidine kinase|nr:hypothetical protein [Clostridia bacterium]
MKTKHISNHIPERYKDGLKLEIAAINIVRERALSYVSAIFSTIIISIILFINDPVIVDKYVSRHSLHIHYILLTASLIFIFLTFKVEKIKKHRAKYLKICHYSIVSIVLLLCAAIGVNNELINQRPFAYVIAMFSIAAVVILGRLERYVIFLTSYALYIAGIAYSIKEPSQVFEVYLFTLPLLGLALMVSAMNYSSFIRNYIYNKLIQEKNQQLDNLQKITEEMLKERTEQLSQAKATEQIRTAFFANISHEFRTPLNLIFSTEQLLDDISKGEDLNGNREKINKCNRIIKQNCYRLTRLIGNLIDMTKLDAGCYNACFRNIDVVKTAEDITMSVASYIKDKEIDLIFDTEFEEKVIAIDEYQIKRVLLNLLSNAVKFTPAGGGIYVSLSEQDGYIIISVRDTGIGIPEDMRNKIFERFIQVDKTTTRCREGSGIGLSLVKELIEMHGGSIQLSSEVGKGSEFVIKLPDNRLSEDDLIECACGFEENEEKIKIEFSDIYN